METTYPDHGHTSPRPPVQRKRSNSFPIVEALGCSDAEASLILAEGRAAISRRQRNPERGSRVRRYHSVNETRSSYKPSNLSAEPKVDRPELSHEEIVEPSNHARVHSDHSIKSTSTIKGLDHSAPTSPSNNPLGNYSANLAKFIQSQLNSISSYRTTHPLSFPRSCPNLLQTSQRSSTSSIAHTANRPMEAPQLISIPPPRPPLRSAFSAWSSADESGNDTDDERPPLPTVDRARQESRASTYTNYLAYYEHVTPSTFLFPSTPLEENENPTVKTDEPSEDVSRPSLRMSRSHPQTPERSHTQSTSSTAYSNPQLTSSSSTTASSYFDRRPLSIGPDLKERVIAAVSPYEKRKTKVLTAISPFEGAALTRVHDILVKNPNRVVVEGLAFDLPREFKMPVEGVRQVRTPC